MARRKFTSTFSSSVSEETAKGANEHNGAGAHVFPGTENLAPRRRPRQERAKFTVAAILEAAAEVIDDLGWARASTNRIAERAGVSIGSLYQYFPNKEAILAGLFEKHHREVDEVVRGSLELLADPDTPLAEVLRKLFRDLIEMHRRDPVLTRVISTEVPLLWSGWNTADGTGHDHAVLLELLGARPEVRATDLPTAVRILEITVEALTRWLMHEAPPTTDVDAFIEESVAMLTGLLFDLRAVEAF